MTAAEHLAAAEQLLAEALPNVDHTGQVTVDVDLWLAEVHALCAIAIELGVPRTAAPEPEQVTQ